jgi:hypothetical protein
MMLKTDENVNADAILENATLGFQEGNEITLLLPQRAAQNTLERKSQCASWDASKNIIINVARVVNGQMLIQYQDRKAF